MTYADTLARIEAARRAVPEIVAEARRVALEEARARMVADWPRRTGRSGDAWDVSDRGLVNTVDYVPYVHDGLVDSLVPRVLAEVEPLFTAEVHRRLDGALGG